MDGKVCVVTGATDGIGRVTARALAERGAEVVLVGRNAAKGAEVCKAIHRSSRNTRVRFEQADLSSQAEIRALAERLTAGGTAIDVLVNNVGGIFTRRRESVDGIEMTFALNHLGYFLLTGLLLESLKASPSGRIVNVASEAHRSGRMVLEDRRARGATAAGAPTVRASLRTSSSPIASRRCWRGRRSRPTVCIPASSPGRFGQNNGWIFATFLKGLMRLSAIDVEAGARTSVHVAASADVEGVSGRYFNKSREATSSLASRDEETAERLWELSESLTGYRY